MLKGQPFFEIDLLEKRAIHDTAKLGISIPPTMLSAPFKPIDYTTKFLKKSYMVLGL